MTPEELALAFPDAPPSEPLPETPVQASPIATPPAAAPVANIAAPVIPGVPPLTPPSHVNDTPAITILESREATDEEVEATISGLLETYPQYSEEELLEIAADEAHGGKITPDSLEELEAAVGAHANGVVTGNLQPAKDESHEFVTVDEAGNVTKWDVKSLRSKYSYDLDQFLTNTLVKDIAKGEHIVFNTQNMNSEDIQELQQALIDDPRFEGRYVLYPAP